MPEELPIVCTLDAENLSARLDLIASIGAAHLISRETEGDSHLLRFRQDEGVRRLLEEVVEAEARCCSFLDLRIREDGEALVLVIAAPPEASSVAAELAAAFATS
jgi:hypothetical protein